MTRHYTNLRLPYLYLSKAKRTTCVVNITIKLWAVGWEEVNEQKTNATDQHASQNFHFMKYWLAVIRHGKRKHNMIENLQLIVVIFILILTLIHENITDCNR